MNTVMHRAYRASLMWQALFGVNEVLAREQAGGVGLKRQRSIDEPPLPLRNKLFVALLSMVDLFEFMTLYKHPAPSNMSEPTVVQYASIPAARVDIDDAAEADSTLEEDQYSASASLTSSVIRYEWKHGRRYHSYQAGQYSFPNDATEQERLDMIHHVFYRLLEDRLIRAPIDPNGLNILDIGTGTGIWAIDVGDQYPGATITGNDLSAIQPAWVPPNVKFLVDNVEADWAEPIQYDYIHCRYMAGSIKDWPRLLTQIYNNLKPGGWVELQESVNTLYSEDNSVKSDDPLVQMMDHLKDACNKIGRTMDPAPQFRSWAERAGFMRIKEERFKLPVGPWPKDQRLKEIGTLMGSTCMREYQLLLPSCLLTY